MELTLSHIPRDQALRYLGYGGREVPDNIQAMADRALAELFPLCRPRYVWRVFDLKSPGEAVLRDSGLAFPGGDVPALLRDCGQCVLMAVTLGDAPEGLIRRTRVRSQTRALILDACASAACEQACDQVQALIEAQLCPRPPYPTDRFSPGYGDLPLSLQPDILALLDAPRQIGLTVTETCLLLPRKSVTALFGLAGRPQGSRVRGCARCSLRGSCSYRKAGMRCE